MYFSISFCIPTVLIDSSLKVNICNNSHFNNNAEWCLVQYESKEMFSFKVCVLDLF